MCVSNGLRIQIPRSNTVRSPFTQTHTFISDSITALRWSLPLLSAMAAEALFLLAGKFEADGFPLQAIHCLLGLHGLTLLPDQEVRTRCSLGRMLLQHTHSTRQAKLHLHAAVSQMGGAEGPAKRACTHTGYVVAG